MRIPLALRPNRYSIAREPSRARVLSGILDSCVARMRFRGLRIGDPNPDRADCKEQGVQHPNPKDSFRSMSGETVGAR
jgi:hypothetical protein